MATFLAIVRKVARDAGTIRLGLPASVLNQSGEEAAVIYYVQEAWRQIQVSRADWLWMRGEFEGLLSPNVRRYSADSFSLPRWAEWITNPRTVTIYNQGVGWDDEGDLGFLDWDIWQRMYERGPQEAQRPVHYSVSPPGEFCVGPKPDVNYVLHAQYRKSPQELAADTDVPEMPARFHDLIADRPLMMLAELQEGEFATMAASRRYRDMMSDLQRDQLPRSGIGMLAPALA